MNKTLAGLVRELRGALEYYYHAQPHGHWSLVEEILDALDEAAIANPPAGAVGRLVEHLNANADDFNRWPMEMKSLIAAVEAALARPAAGEDAVGELLLMLEGASHLSVEAQSLIAAVEAERARERILTFHGRSVDGVHSFTAGGCRNGLNETAISLVFGTQPPEGSRWAIRRLPDPPKPKAKRPWRLPSGMLMCPACEIKQAALSAACQNDECRQYAQTWGDPRDLPGGEEVGG
jgi:hypothetical protein